MGYVENFYAALAVDTLQVSGSATAPGAGTSLAALTLPPGVYEICVYASYGGVAGNFDDMKLRDTTNGVDIFTPLPVAAAANGQPLPFSIRKRFSKTTAIAVQNIGAGPASSVYRAVIIARQLENIIT